MLFSELPLLPELQQALEAKGYQQATPIQAAAIPVILEGKDLLAGARTGTGKTAAFTLPVLQLLLSEADFKQAPKKLQALVLVPTRELAQQVNQNVKDYARGSGLSSACVYGGVSIQPQIDLLKPGVDLLVATPGRLLDLAKKRVLNLQKVRFLIFDEADRMLDMGFKDEIKAVLARLPKREQQPRQTLLFSATLNDNIYRFSKQLLDKPALIEVDQRNSTAEQVEQRVYNCDPERKIALVCHLITQNSWQQVLIFSRTKQATDEIALALNQSGITSEAIHADRSQKAREDALSAFRQGQVQVLVATDVAARGIDIAQLQAVINFEMPFKPEDYVHRIGRTGRAGQQGIAVSLLIEEENHLLEEVETLLDTRLPQQWLPGFEPDLSREIKAVRKNSKSAQRQRAKRRALGQRR